MERKTIMQVGATVRIVDHDEYENIHRVGDVGTVSEVKEESICVAFDQGSDPVEYPNAVVQEIDEKKKEEEAVEEAEQKQVGSGGKDGLPDTSKPVPPQVKTGKVDDLSGEQDQVAQADSKESRPKPNSAVKQAGVTSDQVELKGEQKQVAGVPAGTGGRGKQSERPDVGSSQSDGVGGEQLELSGEQPQVKGVPGREKVKGVKDSVRESRRLFTPISINVLDEADGEDEYVTIGEANSIRSENHLYSALRGAVKSAMEGLDRPFDSVDIVFRRNPVAESKRRKAERTLMGTLHLLAEGKAKSIDVRKAAKVAARLGMKTSRYIEYTDDRYAQKILTEAQRVAEQFINAPPGGDVQPTWPPKKLRGLIGKQVIVDTVTNDRWVGTLRKGSARMFEIDMATGKKRFGMNDVKRILIKRGAK